MDFLIGCFMSKLIYLDTNIFLDYALGTDDIRPLDEFAKQIFIRAINCEFKILISDLLIYELSKYLRDYKGLFKPFQIKDKLEYSKEKYSDKINAKKIKLHYPDNVHLYLAQKFKCDFFVTNDKEILAYRAKIKIVSSQFFQFE
jgi:predicted nucleic acid-binding protein